MLNFNDFNLRLILNLNIKEGIPVFDPGFITKSGKCAFGLNKYWSGCAKQAKWGWISVEFAVIDIFYKTQFTLTQLVLACPG